MLIYLQGLGHNLKAKIIFCSRQYCKVPKHPHYPCFSKRVTKEPVEIELSSIRYLERLSLVNFGNKEGIRILASSINFAENLLQKDTTGIQPLSTVLENRTISLREDIITEGNNRHGVMSNAKVSEEEYFVAPPGNIPLEPHESLQKNLKQ
ncbi:glutamyl-tRNA(Gln) amidotransferase subunit C, mitochondrial [Macrosteles quadrilineatus]|uniref:glutamyl-tRNA(Gln) amidotransferase subunit C, mitochondrial n=1 Tax=Macrosteles quadrilineatus TaxID=74068 RepID=UPI0023E34CB8|nr:glutamyl-tRNA(Gln) amidotransferase subunit C, mitochondrial [Macrosteles quadrilineatus]